MLRIIVKALRKRNETGLARIIHKASSATLDTSLHKPHARHLDSFVTNPNPAYEYPINE